MPPISKVVQVLPQPTLTVKRARPRLPPRLLRLRPSLLTPPLPLAPHLVHLLVLATEVAGGGLGFLT